MASCSGVISDRNFILDKLNDEFSNYLYVFSSEMPLSRLANSISKYIYSHTLSNRYRPFGIRLSIVGYDTLRRTTSLFDIDPSGFCYDSEIVCTGEHSKLYI